MGSFYIMREVREYFGYEDEKDPKELSDRDVGIAEEMKYKAIRQQQKQKKLEEQAKQQQKQN